MQRIIRKQEAAMFALVQVLITIGLFVAWLVVCRALVAAWRELRCAGAHGAHRPGAPRYS
ncbi:hypothetical protein DEW08_30290 (plasmid) [Azospirillum thermophilum]|uniref:Uncharacterized protein n=1 Tax=Azospirillum thermophilum TaxID=2202148 RepID=A0A2S2D0U5_9PROT|nr:hypothetical protein DEW08_30290 [Azospirillum thermophilum]